MERQGLGKVNAYILNLMIFADTQRLDEQEIRDKIETRFKQSKKKRIRPQNIRKFHLEPLEHRHWLRVVDGKYERIGEFKNVKPKQTLIDQFEGVDPEYVESYIQYFEEKRDEEFVYSLTEDEYQSYVEENRPK